MRKKAGEAQGSGTVRSEPPGKDSGRKEGRNKGFKLLTSIGINSELGICLVKASIIERLGLNSSYAKLSFHVI